MSLNITQVSVIVIDYNHWPRMGDFKFDPISWPDVPGMMNNLTKTYNIPEVIIATQRHTEAHRNMHRHPEAHRGTQAEAEAHRHLCLCRRPLLSYPQQY